MVDFKIMKELGYSEHPVFTTVTVYRIVSLSKAKKNDFYSSNAFPGFVFLRTYYLHTVLGFCNLFLYRF